MVTYYCSVCWHESQIDARICPICGTNRSFCSEKTYAEKLMNSLSHPVRDYRLFAVQVLGKIRYAPAEPVLASIISEEGDLEMIKAAAESIRRIQSYQNQDTIEKAAQNRTDCIKRVCGLVPDSSRY